VAERSGAHSFGRLRAKLHIILSMWRSAQFFTSSAELCLARCLAELSARSCVRRSLKRKGINMLTYELQKIIMEEIKKIADKYDGRGITSKYDRDLFDAWYNLLYLITEGVTLQEVNDEINSNLRLKKLKASLKKSSNIFIAAIQ
jgi:hypothetical protein